MTRVTTSTLSEALPLVGALTTLAEALRSGHPGLLDPQKRELWSRDLDRAASLLVALGLVEAEERDGCAISLAGGRLEAHCACHPSPSLRPTASAQVSAAVDDASGRV